LGQKRTHAAQQTKSLFDHFVRNGDYLEAAHHIVCPFRIHFVLVSAPGRYGSDHPYRPACSAISFPRLAVVSMHSILF
jgi:hypothetical protein